MKENSRNDASYDSLVKLEASFVNNVMPANSVLTR